MKIFIFFLITTMNSMPIYSQLMDKDEFIKESKTLESLSDKEFYKELEKLNQELWDIYVENYAKKYNLSEADFPKEIPEEISLRIKGTSVKDLKERMKNPDKSMEETEKQFKDILDGVRTKKWKLFSMQEWIRSQSGYKKPADEKEIESKIESRTMEKIKIKHEEDRYSFFKQPLFITLAAFLLFIFGMLIFKKGK